MSDLLKSHSHSPAQKVVVDRSKSRSHSPVHKELPSHENNYGSPFCKTFGANRNRSKDRNSDNSRSRSASPARNGDRKKSGRAGRSSGSPQDMEEIIIEADMAKHIIGRAGANVRHLEETSSCRINISREETKDGKVKIELTGNPKQRQRAQKLIEDIIENDGRGGGSGSGSRDRGYSGGSGGRSNDRGYGDRNDSRGYGDRNESRGYGGGRDSRNGGGSGNYRGNSGSNSRGCYHCGKDGHIARECPDGERSRRH